ncbi:MAG: histidine kinase [Candidatus Omnitrophota bacterium]
MKLSKTIHYATLSAAFVGFVFTLFISHTFVHLHRSFTMAHYERVISENAFYLHSLLSGPNPLSALSPLPPQEGSFFDKIDLLLSQSQGLSKDDEEKKTLAAMQKDLRGSQQYLSQLTSPALGKDPAALAAFREKVSAPITQIRDEAGRLVERYEEAVRARLHIAQGVTVFFLFLLLGFTAIAILWSHLYLFRPLRALEIGAEKIWEGDFQYRLDSTRPDEIGHLSRTMKKMTDHLLDLQKRIEQEAQQKLQAQHELLDIQEIERKRMGQDLHDGIAQRLVGISFMAQLAEGKLSQQKPLDAGDLKNLTEEIKKTLEETRQLAHGFYPVDLQHCGLAPALRNLAQTFESTFRIQCDFTCPEDRIVEDPDIEAHLYRTAQEAMQNAIRHGGAKEIRIEYGKRQDTAFLSIADNGKGFSPGTEGIQRGIGFRSMYYRAALIHGTISVETRKNRGTRITVRCPLKLPHPHPDIDTTPHLVINADKTPSL